jgi:photosynthetic reaction center H subunit
LTSWWPAPISDIWVDRSEQMLRYLEVTTEVGDAPRQILVPINFGVFRKTRDGERIFYVHALKGEQFASVPGLQDADSITLLEEKRSPPISDPACSMPTPSRQEPLA